MTSDSVRSQTDSVSDPEAHIQTAIAIEDYVTDWYMWLGTARIRPDFSCSDSSNFTPPNFPHENYDRREACSPVALSDRRHREQNKPKRDNEWTSDQRSSSTIAGDESTGPTREKKDEQNQRKDSSTGGCGGIALDLDQVQWE
jgi:hypothetical protein